MYSPNTFLLEIIWSAGKQQIYYLSYTKLKCDLLHDVLLELPSDLSELTLFNIRWYLLNQMLTFWVWCTSRDLSTNFRSRTLAFGNLPTDPKPAAEGEYSTLVSQIHLPHVIEWWHQLSFATVLIAYDMTPLGCLKIWNTHQSDSLPEIK